MGAVTTTFIAGVEAIKLGMSQPIGSVTQLNTIRLGKRTDGRSPHIKDFVSLATLDDIVFGGWDLFPANAYEAAKHADVLTNDHLTPVKDELSAITPMPAVFFPEYVKRLRGENVKKQTNKMELAEAVRQDIRDFQKRTGVTRTVAVWCGSTEVHHEAVPAALAHRHRIAHDDPHY
jgi:myo-inositol-1-phosphate synthase